MRGGWAAVQRVGTGRDGSDRVGPGRAVTAMQRPTLPVQLLVLAGVAAAIPSQVKIGKLCNGMMF